MKSNLWERSLWLNTTMEYIFGSRIVEYDMKSAGLSLVTYFKLLPESTIDDIRRMEKKARVIKLGLIQREDKEFAKKLSDAFKEARRMFFEANGLDEESILSIKKDAFFLVDSYPKTTEFGEIKFVEKNKYSTFFYLNKLEFYLNTKLKEIDIKGLGQNESLDKVKEMHGDYMLSFFQKFSKMKELNSDEVAMANFLCKFVKEYRNKELPIGYYRELNREHMYSVYDTELDQMLKIKDTGDTEKLDVSYNYFNYIVPLVNLCI